MSMSVWLLVQWMVNFELLSVKMTDVGGVMIVTCCGHTLALQLQPHVE
jgi:hypothetical protein